MEVVIKFVSTNLDHTNVNVKKDICLVKTARLAPVKIIRLDLGLKGGGGEGEGKGFDVC